MPASAAFEAFFLAEEDGFAGRRFCIHHPARGRTVRGAILYLPPFAEEMNKSRRMAALQARAFARMGYAVLQIDLLGCGDSAGDFAEASWQSWIDDGVQACRWLQRRAERPLWLWGLRAGCLLAADVARRLDAPCHFLLWQPAPSGKLLLQQFLRLRPAGDMLGGAARGASADLMRQSSAGEVIDIAGYPLAPALASGLQDATFPAPPHPGRVEWIELSTRADATLLPASAPVMARWAAAGAEIRSQVVHGPSFWQTTEIEEAPALIAASPAAIAEIELSVR